MTYVINGKGYENTIKVSRELPRARSTSYAKAGLIAVSKISAGNPEFVLTETYGNVANTRCQSSRFSCSQSIFGIYRK